MWRGRAHEIRSRQTKVAAKRFNTFDIVAGAIFRLGAAPQHAAEPGFGPLNAASTAAGEIE